MLLRAHGKTTQLVASIIEEARILIFLLCIYVHHKPGAVLSYYGSECALFEACEYQDHFLGYD
jgi:UDP-N-acetylmuramate--alanine ligase